MGEKKLEDVLKYLSMNYKCTFMLYIRFFSFSFFLFLSLFISPFLSLFVSPFLSLFVFPFLSLFVLLTYCLFCFIEVCNSIFYVIFIEYRFKFNIVGQGVLNRNFLKFFFFHSASCNRLKIIKKIKK